MSEDHEVLLNVETIETVVTDDNIETFETDENIETFGTDDYVETVETVATIETVETSDAVEPVEPHDDHISDTEIDITVETVRTEENEAVEDEDVDNILISEDLDTDVNVETVETTETIDAVESVETVETTEDDAAEDDAAEDDAAEDNAAEDDAAEKAEAVESAESDSMETSDEEAKEAEELFSMFPHISRNAIINDLRYTNSVDATAENILEGNLTAEEEIIRRDRAPVSNRRLHEKIDHMQNIYRVRNHATARDHSNRRHMHGQGSSSRAKERHSSVSGSSIKTEGGLNGNASGGRTFVQIRTTGFEESTPSGTILVKANDECETVLVKPSDDGIHHSDYEADFEAEDGTIIVPIRIEALNNEKDENSNEEGGKRKRKRVPRKIQKDQSQNGDPAENKPYKCEMCHWQFKQRYRFKRHMRTHTGERPYQCPKCEKQFSRSHILKVHMMIHSGEKPFTCAECGWAFMKKYHLQRHMRTHTGEMPFVCHECNVHFSRPYYLKKHLVSAHGAVIEDTKPSRKNSKGNKNTTMTDEMVAFEILNEIADAVEMSEGNLNSNYEIKEENFNMSSEEMEVVEADASVDESEQIQGSSTASNDLLKLSNASEANQQDQNPLEFSKQKSEPSDDEYGDRSNSFDKCNSTVSTSNHCISIKPLNQDKYSTSTDCAGSNIISHNDSQNISDNKEIEHNTDYISTPATESINLTISRNRHNVSSAIPNIKPNFSTNQHGTIVANQNTQNISTNHTTTTVRCTNVPISIKQYNNSTTQHAMSTNQYTTTPSNRNIHSPFSPNQFSSSPAQYTNTPSNRNINHHFPSNQFITTASQHTTLLPQHTTSQATPSNRNINQHFPSNQFATTLTERTMAPPQYTTTPAQHTSTPAQRTITPSNRNIRSPFSSNQFTGSPAQYTTTPSNRIFDQHFSSNQFSNTPAQRTTTPVQHTATPSNRTIDSMFSSNQFPSTLPQHTTAPSNRIINQHFSSNQFTTTPGQHTTTPSNRSINTPFASNQFTTTPGQYTTTPSNRSINPAMSTNPYNIQNNNNSTISAHRYNSAAGSQNTNPSISSNQNSEASLKECIQMVNHLVDTKSMEPMRPDTVRNLSTNMTNNRESHVDRELNSMSVKFDRN